MQPIPCWAAKWSRSTPPLTSDSDITTLLVCERSRTGSVLIAKRVLKSYLKHGPLWKRAVSTALSNVFKIFYFLSWSSSPLTACWVPEVCVALVEAQEPAEMWFLLCHLCYLFPGPYPSTQPLVQSLLHCSRQLCFLRNWQKTPLSSAFLSVWAASWLNVPSSSATAFWFPHVTSPLGPVQHFHIVLWNHYISTFFSFHNRKQFLNHFIHCH